MNKELKIRNIIALASSMMITSQFLDTPAKTITFYKHASPYLFNDLTENDIEQIIETLENEQKENLI